LEKSTRISSGKVRFKMQTISLERKQVFHLDKRLEKEPRKKIIVCFVHKVISTFFAFKISFENLYLMKI
jgi:hypothetical protein